MHINSSLPFCDGNKNDGNNNDGNNTDGNNDDGNNNNIIII